MKVFLGGTCNDSTWRDELIPQLKIDYFNPVVKDWTQECQERELREREESDFCLYVITPRMIGTYAIAEIIDDSNKRPEQTIVCFLRGDTGCVFNDAQWKSLIAVARMVNDNGAVVLDSLESVAVYLNTEQPVKHEENEDQGLSFGMAMEAMKEGYLTRRPGWNGNGMFCRIQWPKDSKMTHPYLYLTIPECSEGTRMLPWQPAQVDIFANDWEILGPEKR